MPKLLCFLQNVHDLLMKLGHSGSHIYTGGIDSQTWSKRSKSQQK